MKWNKKKGISKILNKNNHKGIAKNIMLDRYMLLSLKLIYIMQLKHG